MKFFKKKKIRMLMHQLEIARFEQYSDECYYENLKVIYPGQDNFYNEKIRKNNKKIELRIKSILKQIEGE